ncbi:MAG TPA: sulfotransferase, partial [Anaerolineales bacterium]|nr:sulfotransferase [Anaerolineales bacterium]
MTQTSRRLKQRLRDAWSVLAHGAKVVQKRADLPSLTPEEIADVKEFFPMDKFFIFGHSRSGNTLLMRLVRLHPEVHANYQGTFFSRPPGLKSLVNSPEIEEWLSRETNRWNRGRDLSPLIMRAAADFVMERDARFYKKHIVGDKSPTTITSGQAIRDAHKIYPDVKIVYIVRDGRDVMVSDRFRNFVEEKFLRAGDKELIASFRSDPKLFTGGGCSIFTEAWL